MPYFEHKSVSFHYKDSGKGTAVILLHGFLENADMWNELTGYLPKHYRIIALDLPGHGKSENLSYRHTMLDMAEVVRSLMKHLRLKKCFMGGHSLGGYVSLAFGEQYPELLRGMMLINSTARGDSPAKQKDRDRAILAVKRGHRSFIRAAIPNLFRPKNRRIMADKVNEVKQLALETSQQGIIATLEGMKIRPDREVLLHFAPYPILFVAGQHDPVLPFDTLEEQLKGHRVTPIITENGHMGHIEDQEVVFEGVKRFLKQ